MTCIELIMDLVNIPYVFEYNYTILVTKYSIGY